MRLRLPKHASRLTDDCKQIKWAVLDYYWHDGKLIKRDAENQFDGSIPQSSRQQVVEVHLTSFQFLHEAQHNFQNDTSLFAFKPWRIEGAVRHYKYPLELYPKFYWAGPDQPPINTSSDARWGVVGTKNAITQYPSTTACGIVHSASEPEANIIKGDFPNDYSDAKCRGGISIVKGDKVAFGMIDVWANNAHDIDKIYNAVISKIQTYIQE